MKIGIIGAGYVGLVTGSCFAHLGHKVICVDHDKSKIQTLKRGKIPFYEPGLSEMVTENVTAGRLTFHSKVSTAVAHSEVLFICVHTPSLANGEADLSFVGKVAREIARNLKSYRLVVEKSTVPVQTGEWIQKTMERYVKKGVHFDVASNPEFLREGSALHDFLAPSRIVVGVTSKRAEKILRKIYLPLEAPLLVTDIKSAELIKHASNSFLATKISFANILARICDTVGADVEKVTHGMGLDPRIGHEFLKAGIGFGGSCFPKDLSAFLRISDQLGIRFDLLYEVLKINTEQANYFLGKISKTLRRLKGKTIGVLGLSFKPDTDDMRSAPSIPILHALEHEGVKIQAYDPQAMGKAAALFKNVRFSKNPYEAAHKVDAILVLTEWSEFLNLDWKRIKRNMKHPYFFDGRNMFQPHEMKKNGFHYISVGRLPA